MAIDIKPSRRGLFTSKAKAAGMDVQDYANKVLSDPNAPLTLRREAGFARSAAHFNHNQKAVKKVGKILRKAASS